MQDLQQVCDWGTFKSWDLIIVQTWSHKHTAHSGAADWHTYINIYLHQLLFAHSSYFYYIKWLNGSFTDIKYLLSTMTFLFKNSLVNVIYLLIRCYKTRFVLWNTNNTDTNGVNKQNTHTRTRTKHSEKITLERVR